MTRFFKMWVCDPRILIDGSIWHFHEARAGLSSLCASVLTLAKTGSAKVTCREGVVGEEENKTCAEVLKFARA